MLKCVGEKISGDESTVEPFVERFRELVLENN